MACVFAYSFGVKNHVSNWILDFGAIDHMVSNLNTRFEIKNVSMNGLFINLPNGSFVPINYIGKYRITHDIVLNKVLYVPDFRFN